MEREQAEKESDTFHVLLYNDIPVDCRKEITYMSVVYEVHPQKEEPKFKRITIGCNHMCYPGNVRTNTASLELFKLVVNIILLSPGAKFACFDVKNIYLGNPLDRPEYVRIKLSAILQEFTNEYNLIRHARDELVYFEIRKGVYRLPQPGRLANNQLRTWLDKEGYYKTHTIPGLCCHIWRPVLFSLVVDDFGLEYASKKYIQHLLYVLK